MGAATPVPPPPTSAPTSTRLPPPLRPSPENHTHSCRRRSRSKCPAREGATKWPQAMQSGLAASVHERPSGLLIRGLGVQVPRGAPVIKALAWSFSPVRSLLHVHYGRLGAR